MDPSDGFVGLEEEQGDGVDDEGFALSTRNHVELSLVIVHQLAGDLGQAPLQVVRWLVLLDQDATDHGVCQTGVGCIQVRFSIMVLELDYGCFHRDHIYYLEGVIPCRQLAQPEIDGG